MGVLAYEVASGKTPFGNSNTKSAELRKNINNVNFIYPKHFSPNLKNFIGSLLKKNPKARMSLRDAQNHPWITSNTGKKNK